MRIFSILLACFFVSACSLRGYVQPVSQEELHLSPYASAVFQRCLQYSAQRFCPNGDNCNGIVSLCVNKADQIARDARRSFNQYYYDEMAENCKGDLLCSLEYQKQIYNDMFEVSLSEAFPER